MLAWCEVAPIRHSMSLVVVDDVVVVVGIITIINIYTISTSLFSC